MRAGKLASKLFASAALALLLVSAHIPVVRSQEQPKTGITVAPANITIVLPQGSGTAESAVSVRNNAASSVRLVAKIGGVRQAVDGSFGPSDTVDEGIAKSLSVDQSEVNLGPGKSVNFKLHVQDVPALRPGGHYASLLIREVAEPGQSLSLSHAVSVRIFLVKEAGAVRALNVQSVRDNGGPFRLPTNITVGFGNAGNVGVVPRASVLLYDPRGALVARGVLNTESITVQPGQQAQLQASISRTGRAWLPGQYEQQIVYRYEGSDEQLIARSRLFVVPPFFIGSALVGVSIIGGIGFAVWHYWPRKQGAFTVKEAPAKAVRSNGKSPSGQLTTSRQPQPAHRRYVRRIDI